jgi:hypothetical protein
MHTVKGWKELTELLDKIRTRVGRELKRPVEFVSCYEAGYDGFWIHRLLEKNCVRNFVVDPASLQVDRRARHVKTRFRRQLRAHKARPFGLRELTAQRGQARGYHCPGIRRSASFERPRTREARCKVLKSELGARTKTLLTQ